MTEVLARAVHAAHEKGVVHRDLKPANILLVAGGTPKVADFGLAKRIDDESGDTRTGAVMGTPGYMAPEQARGKTREVGPPADIYALGAVLYECLTGRPPFRAASVVETLEMVVAQEPVPPRQLNAKVPRDLDTIALKCLRKEAGKRYGSAADLAADLGRFLGGRPILARPVGVGGRLLRAARRRPLVAGLLTGLAVVTVSALVVVSLLYSRAVSAATLAREQRDRAEANLKLAKKAIDDCFFLGKDDPFMQSEGTRQFKLRLLAKTIPFYRDSYLSQRPDDPAAHEELGRQQFNLAYVLEETGDKQEAVEALHEAIRQFEAVVEADPADYRNCRNLALARGNRALLLSQLGKTSEALSDYRRVLDAHQDLMRQDPANDCHVTDFAVVNSNVSSLLSMQGKSAEALNYCETALEALSRFPETRQNDAELVSLRAQVLNNAGVLLRELGRMGDAQTRWKAAVDLRRRLVAGKPEVGVYREGLGQSLTNFGVLLRDLGQSAAAIPLQQEAVELNRGLSGRHPTVTAYQVGLGRSLHNLGNALMDVGQLDDATHHFLQALPIRRQLVTAHPSSVDHWLDLGKNHYVLALAQERQKKPTEAEASRKEAVRVLELLATDHPDLAEASELLANTWRALADMQAGRDELPAAVATYEKAAAILRGVLAREPGRAAVLESVGNLLCNQAIAEAALGRRAEALAHYDEAVATQRKLLRDQPRRPDLTNGLAITLLNRSGLHHEMSRPNVGLADLDEALGLAEKLRNSPPDMVRAIHLRRGKTLVAMGRHADAAETWGKVVPLVPEQYQPNYLLEQAESFFRAGMDQAAATTAEKASRHPAVDGDNLYRAARTLVRCAGAARKDGSRLLALRMHDAEARSRRAVEVLRRAADGGKFATPAAREKLDGDAELAPLGPREDYVAFRRGLVSVKP